MARARSPDRIEAEEIYLEHEGNIELVKIAEVLDRPQGTIRGWKNKDKWDDKLNGTFQEKGSKNTERSNIKQNEKKESNKPIADEVKQVMNNPELTDKQRLFCLYYVKTFNATKAYKKAYGVDYNTAASIAYRLLENDGVKAEIHRLKQNRLNQAFLEPSDIFQKYMDIAFADITDFISFGQEEVAVMGPFGPIVVKDEDTGKKTEITKIVNTVKFKDSSDIDGTLISEVKQGRDGASIKLHDRMKALQWLADHMDMATEEQKLRIDKLKAEVDKLKEGKEDTNIRVTIVDDIEGDADEG